MAGVSSAATDAAKAGGLGGAASSLNPAMAGLSAGLNLTGGIVKMIMGGKLKREGIAEEKAAIAPIYQRPEEIAQMARLSALSSIQGLPNENLLIDRARATTANTLDAAKDFGGSASVYRAQVNENSLVADIGYKSAASRMDKQLQHLAALERVAEYTDKEWDTNVYIPWQEKRKRALDKIGAGTANMMAGLDQISTSAGGGQTA